MITVDVNEWADRPSRGVVAILIGQSGIEAFFIAAAVGLVVAPTTKLGAGLAAAGGTWAVLWIALTVRTIRARVWRNGISELVIRNRWWTYHLPLTAIEHVRIGTIGGGANPEGVIVTAPTFGRNPWHRQRGLPVDGTASYNAAKKNAQIAAFRKMSEDARRRRHG